MNEIKQAEIYLRVLWLNDNENLRPDSINIKLDGETTENVVFSISQNDNNIGNNSLWENVTEWANGITYNYQKIIENEDNSQPQEENSPKTEEINKIKENNIPYVIPSVINIPSNYRCNILKNVETETYSYYTIKMTYVPPKRKLMARSTTPTLNFNGTIIENVNFNNTEVEKVVFNGTTVFEKKKADFASLILANSTLNEGTPNFSLTATTDEGMFATEDMDGTSYYFRGAVTNNYVKFAGFWWRIIRINGDGTVRLIYDGTSGHANGTSTVDAIAIRNQPYNNFYYVNNSYVGWTYVSSKQRPDDGDVITDSNAKIQVEEWYSNNIDNKPDHSSKIVNGKFCNDREVAEGYVWSSSDEIKYSGRSRCFVKYAPTLMCNPNDVYALKVGLITADELMYAGGKGYKNDGTSKNISYYLYHTMSYWTMTPWSGESNNNYAYVSQLSSDGVITASYTRGPYGLRPVINLHNNIEVTGTGTMEDPYVVVGDE